MTNNFYKIFGIRTAICFFIIVSIMFTCVLRLVSICGETETKAAGVSKNTVSLTISDNRGSIFDCNGEPLTGTKAKILAAVCPTPTAITALSGVLSGEVLKSSLDRLKTGKPIIVEVPKEITADGITCFYVNDRYTANTPTQHILGYLDYLGHGVTGIEKTYDDLLYSDIKRKISYTIDARGNILPGFDPIIEGADENRNAVYLTIDSEIQKITEDAAANLKTGAVVVTDVATGKIKAMVSKPGYDATKVANYINDPATPLINRALSAFNVGSIFKPCVAAAAIESGDLENYTYTCTGRCVIEGHAFNCHKLAGHGLVDLKTGIAQSCNTYFYNLAQQVKPSVLYGVANSFGFGEQRVLADGIVGSSGYLTTTDELAASKKTVANFAIGQGNLVLSPLALSSLYTAIANGGQYYAPTLIEGVMKNNEFTKGKRPEKTVAISKRTADILKEDLAGVIETGTGTMAKPATGGACGKTATAQTGWVKDGKAVIHAWFCGFFPKDTPKYVVVVFAENAKSGGSDCGPVFKAIADKINSMGY